MVEGNCISVASSLNVVLSQLNLYQKRSLVYQETDNICFHLETLLQLHAPIKIKKVLLSSSEYICFSNSPFIVSMMEFAMDYEEKPSTLLLSQKLYYLVSVPTTFSNELVKCGCTKNNFDGKLFIERLCDAILLFSLQDIDKDDEGEADRASVRLSFASCRSVSVAAIQVIAKLGHLHVFLDRLLLYLLENKLTISASERLTIVGGSIFELSVIQQHPSSRKQIKFSRYEKYFVEFLATLLSLIDSNPSFAPSLELVYSHFLSEDNWNNCQLAVPFNSFKSMLLNSLFSEVLLSYCPSRQVLGFLFNRLLKNLEESGVLPDIKECLCRTVKAWSNKEWLRNSDVDSDCSLMSGVIYIIMFYVRIEGKLPYCILSDILEGVSLRLGNTQNVLFREHGMTVAAAYASLAVDENDGNVLLDNEDYSRLYSEWVRTENSFFPQGQKKMTSLNHLENEPLVCNSHSFPMNPDDEHFFFTVNLPMMPQAVGAVANVSNDWDLQSFGITERKEDRLDKNIQVLTSIRQCYNAIVGIGRTQNAQLVEIQQSIESGLRGFQHFFDSHGKNGKKMEEAQNELGPLSPSLLHSLIHVSIHAPDAKLKELLLLRYSAIVNIISVCPKVALLTVSSLLYSGSLSVIQRAELARAVGDAAVSLSNTEITEGKKSSEEEVKKRIYPPINNGTPRASKEVGKNIRRWGYAAHTKKNLPLTWNRLADISSSFVEALLSRSDTDHFKFFQDSDPYTPSEILRSLIKIFQSIANVGHIAQIVCLNNIDFFLCVITTHKIDSVRKLGWVAFEEVMRCWCGAPAHFVVRNEDLVINKVKHFQESVFAKEWLAVLNTAENLCEKLVLANEPCTPVAIRVVSNLRDLVNHNEDVVAINNNYCCGVSIA